MSIEVCQAALDNPEDCGAIIEILDSYSQDPRGDNQPLPDQVKRELIPALREHPTTVVFLAHEKQCAVGAAICFRGLSTFRARPLLNVHDLAVVPSHRGRGVGRVLLDAAQQHAVSTNCCKLTLEVQDDNVPAIGLYRSFGFSDFVIAGEQRKTLFLQKALPPECSDER